MSKLTVNKLVRMYLMRKLESGDRVVSYNDMADLRQWAIKQFDIMHRTSTYEREFRRLKKKVNDGIEHPQFKEFRSIPQVEKNYDKWEIIPNDNQTAMF